MSDKGRKVVLRIEGNLTFVGKYVDDFEFNGDRGKLVQLDPISRVMLWCPDEKIENLIPLVKK